MSKEASLSPADDEVCVDLDIRADLQLMSPPTVLAHLHSLAKTAAGFGATRYQPHLLAMQLLRQELQATADRAVERACIRFRAYAAEQKPAAEGQLNWRAFAAWYQHMHGLQPATLEE